MINKRNLFKLLILIILTFGSNTMSLGQMGAVAAGGEIKSGDFVMSFSVGQPVYTNISQDNILISQGLQHPKIRLFTKIHERETDEVSFTVYPNPASENLNIDLNENNMQELKLVILSLDGKILIKEIIQESKHAVAVKDLKPGTYILLISNGNQVLSSYQIIKQ